MINRLSIGLLIGALIAMIASHSSLRDGGISDALAAEVRDYKIAYGALLSKHAAKGEKKGIRAMLVNYDGWKTDPLHEKTMQAIKRINPKTLAGKKKMAFWINAYNLLTIDLIIKTGERKNIRNQGTLFRNVWKSHHWTIYDKLYTLDEIEHKILRKMDEPRIHFAINCASLSCPDLLDQPYEAEKLDRQLEKQSRLFIKNRSKGVKISQSGVMISKIFDWFEEDFGGKKGAVNFIRKRSSLSGKKIEIRGYLKYDWSLNSQAG